MATTDTVVTRDPGRTSHGVRESLRALAIERLEERAAFRNHLVAYLLVNAVLTAVWFVTSSGGLFWPIFLILGWGIGLLCRGLETYRRPYTEDQIEQVIVHLMGEPPAPR
jgi:hypothetical protein